MLPESEWPPEPALDPESDPDVEPESDSDMLPESEPPSVPEPDPVLPESDPDPESDPVPEPSPWEPESPAALPLSSSIPLDVADEPSLPIMLGAEEDMFSGFVACCPPQAARISVQAIAGASLNRERDMIEFSSVCALSRLAMNDEIPDPMHQAESAPSRGCDDSDACQSR